MTLSRSMTIGLVPILGVAALGWSISRRTPLRVMIRNGALATAAGLAVALWWWVVRWPAVSDYLFGGGSADTDQYNDLLAKARVHSGDLATFVGAGVLIVALGSYVGLRLIDRLPAVGLWARAKPAPESRARSQDERLAIWPLMAAVVGGIAVLSVGTALGVGFAMPLLPWLVTAGVAAVWRTLPNRLWLIWASVAVLAALAQFAAPRGSGLNSAIWCASDSPRSNCAVETVADGEAWSKAIVQVGDRIWRARSAAPDEWEFNLALLSRDLLLNGNTLGLDAELRRQVTIDFFGFFPAGLSEEEQLSAMVRSADLLVVAADYRPDEIILGTFQPNPQVALDTARAAGFTPCGEVSLPDGRAVTFLARPDAPRGTCDA